MTTTGSEWLNNLPENPGTGRDNALLEAVNQNLLTFNWTCISSTIEENTVVIDVLSDAAFIVLDDGSRFRPQISAKLQQTIADQLDLSFMTSKIMDLSYQQCEQKAEFTPLTASPQMSTTTYSKNFNQKLELKRKNYDLLWRDCGKAWILSNRLHQLQSGMACNHGFYSPSAKSDANGVKVIQSSGCMHDHSHQDYSQVIFFMKKTCILNVTETSIYDIMNDKVLSNLINYDGILLYQKQL